MHRITVSGLSYPPGKNRVYDLVRRRKPSNREESYTGLALSAEANAWRDEVIVRTRAARGGVRIDTNRRYWMAVIVHLWSLRMDADAPLSLACDAVQDALGLNDTMVGFASGVKSVVSDPKDRACDLYVGLTEVTIDFEFAALSAAVLGRIGEALGWAKTASE